MTPIQEQLVHALELALEDAESAARSAAFNQTYKFFTPLLTQERNLQWMLGRLAIARALLDALLPEE